MPDTPLVGREDAQLALTTWRKQGQGHALLTGAAGTGRTALLRWLVADTRAAGGNAFLVTGTAARLEPALGPWTRLAVAAARAGIDAPQLLLTPPREPDDAQLHLAALQLLERIAGDGTAVVGFDDLHAFDTASLGLLARLAADPEVLPLLLVATLRSIEEHPDATGRGALGWLARTERHLHLDVLTPADARVLVVALAGEAAAPWAQQWAEPLCELAAGLPVLLAALIADLGIAEGARPALDTSGPDAGACGGGPTRGPAAPAPWPRRVVTALERRLATLEEDLREVATVVALADGDLDAGVLAAVLERDVEHQLRAGIDTGLLRRGPLGRLSLTHPALGALLRDGAVPQRSTLHARIAGALAGQPRREQDAAIVLHHLVAAGPQADPSRIVQLVDEVLTSPTTWRSATEEAEALEPAWRLAAREDRGPRWRGVGLRLAAALRHSGQPRRSAQVAREVLSACPHDATHDLVAAANAVVRGQDRSYDAPAAVRTLIATARRLGDVHPQTPRLLATAGEVAVPLLTARGNETTTSRDSDAPDGPVLGWSLHSGEAVELVHRADRLLAAAPDGGDPDVAARVDVAWAEVHRGPGQLTERLRRAERARRTTTDTDTHARACARSVVDHLEAGDRSAVDRALAELATTATTLDDPSARWLERTTTSMLALASGDPAAALRATEQAHVSGQHAGYVTAWTDRLIQASSAAIEADAALPDDAGELPEIVADHPLRAAGWCWLGAVAPELTSGTHPTPAQLLARRGAGWVDVGQDLLFLTLVADAAWRGRDVAVAQELLELLVAWQERVAVDALGIYTHGCVARPVAGLYWLVGDLDASLAAERLGTQVHDRCGLHRFRLMDTIDATIRGRADGRLSRELAWRALRAAGDEARERGLTRLAGEVNALLGPDVADRLTARQLAVLRALTTDATLNQIAATLGYSHGTVRKDAIAIYRTLDVDGRDGAAEVARAVGLVATAPASGAPGSQTTSTQR